MTLTKMLSKQDLQNIQHGARPQLPQTGLSLARACAGLCQQACDLLQLAGRSSQSQRKLQLVMPCIAVCNQARTAILASAIACVIVHAVMLFSLQMCTCRLASAAGKDDDMEAAIAQVGIEVYSAMDAATS